MLAAGLVLAAGLHAPRSREPGLSVTEPAAQPGMAEGEACPEFSLYTFGDKAFLERHRPHLACMESYAELHGYPLVVEEVPAAEPGARGLLNTKPRRILAQLQQQAACTPLLVFFDADFCVVQKASSLQHVLGSVEGGECDFAGQDSPSTLNTGFLVLRRTAAVLGLLRRWDVMATATTPLRDDQWAMQEVLLELASVSAGKPQYKGECSQTARTLEAALRDVPCVWGCCYNARMESYGLPENRRSFRAADGMRVCAWADNVAARVNPHDAGETYRDGDFGWHSHEAPPLEHGA